MKVEIMAPTVDITLNESKSPPVIKRDTAKSSRRSVVLQRRLSPLDSTPVREGQILSQEGSEENLVLNNTSSTDSISFSDYLARVKDESEAWTNIYNERKQKYRNIRNFQPESLTLESCGHLFSEAETTYFSERPNYDELSKSVTKCVENTLIAAAIKHKAVHATRVVAGKVHKRLHSMEIKIVRRD